MIQAIKQDYIDAIPVSLRQEIRESAMHPIKCGLPMADEAYFAMFGDVLVADIDIEMFKSIVDEIWRGEIPAERSK